MPDEPPLAAPWRPIPLVGVDLDSLETPASAALVAGERVWVEVTKDGQVVGVEETTALEGALTPAFLSGLTTTFAQVTVDPRPAIDPATLPHATVVVPSACHDIPRLLATVHSLLALDYDDLDVIVVDNRPAPDREALPTMPGGERVTVVHEPRRGTSAARNRGLAEATGEFVAFTDDDVVVDAGWLRALVERFITNPEVDVIGGLVLPFELATAPQLWFEEFFGGFSSSYRAQLLSLSRSTRDDPLFPFAPGCFGAGCNMALRRSAFDTDAFDVLLGPGTPSRGGEDIALFIERVLAGGTHAFEPRALVRHTHRRSEEAFFTQVFGYGTGLTATYASLIHHDPSTLFKILRRLPGGLRLLLASRRGHSPSATTTYPRKAHVVQIAGLAYGPVAYLRSVWAARRAGASLVARETTGPESAQ